MKKRIIKKYHLKENVKDELLTLFGIAELIAVIIILYIIIY